MSSDKAIILRYHTAGHVRFQIPGRLCTPAARRSIEAGLREIEGIYRIDFYPRQHKVSIRFIEQICSFDQLNTVLYRVADDVAVAAPVPGCCATTPQSVPSVPQRHKPGLAPIRWLRAKLTSTSASLGMPALPWLKESTVVEFLNDALVLFLIKLHWHMITQHWLRQPWRYRYEWMAALYLIYLLVRSRRPKKS